MSTNGEAERKPSRPVWRRAVLAHIKLSTLERRKHHIEEQQRSVTPLQVAYNQQDIVQPEPVHLNGNPGASFVEDLETIAKEMGILHPNALDTNDFLAGEEIYDPGPIIQPAVLGYTSVPKGTYVVSPLASLLFDLDYEHNQASRILHENFVPQADVPRSSNRELAEKTTESSSQWFSRLGDWSRQDEDSCKEALIPPHNTPVESGDVSPVNTSARAPSLDRGPSIRLQKALAEDQEAWEPLKKPINELVATSEPLPPSGTQNGLLQAAERAGVWRNEMGVPCAAEEKANLVQKRHKDEVEMARRLRAGLEMKIEKRPCYLLWLEERHQLSTERMLASATTRLADYLEGYKAVSLRELCRRRGLLGDCHGQVSV
ncbi:hypothetical protein CABS01_11148 [Colletotrichum abscissum]|uniref:Uncharacterized protein n=1 Tax=Colletotrichum abscissum TaxID=1671311 RepID=A0A9Q0B1A4_9PEZI|nr:uncharacterized protein CABS01_11148 [Colletotrichum abscissum]KAI3547470.1 hypothetical protein CABS02_08660 [Colletotrichum abscissum]KAK1494920.1 hypothetical protein CABS01_11148 [Colletotrichum abscissum]